MRLSAENWNAAAQPSDCVSVANPFQQFPGIQPPQPLPRTELFFFAGSTGETSDRTAQYSMVCASPGLSLQAASGTGARKK